MEVQSNLTEVAARLREGHVGLMAAMRTELRASVKSAKNLVRQSALDTLPKTGGANQWVADAVIGTRVILSPVTTQVAVTMSKKGHDLWSINAGKLRHPVYGNPSSWALTLVTPGFFTKPLAALRPAVTTACMAACLRTAEMAGFDTSMGLGVLI